MLCQCKVHAERSVCLGQVAQPAHPFARCFTALRVSCGVSALGRAVSFRLGPSRSVALASAPGHPETDERDQRCVRSVPASHHSVDQHSYPVCSRFHRHRLFVGRVPSGVPPTWTGDLHASRRAWSLRRVPRVSWGRVLPRARLQSGSRPRVTVPLTPLSRLPLDTGARFSRAR